MAVPTRTCVGCRRRTVASDLVRLTVVDGRPRPRTGRGEGVVRGRGASIHATEACLTAAVKTNAFARAFRQTLVPLRLAPAGGDDAAFRSLFVDIEVARGLQQRGARTP